MAKGFQKNVAAGIDDDYEILAITGANVINVVDRKIYEDTAIVCHKGKITGIQPSSSVSIPENAKRIPLSGQYIIPGLIDAHVHLAHPGVDDYGRISSESMAKKYRRNAGWTLRSGVTAVRNMPGSYGYSILKFRDRVNKGRETGPRIFASGPALTVPFGYFSLKRFIPAPPALLQILSVIFGAYGLSIDIDDPGKVPEIIRKLKKTGVDFIKTVTPGSFISLVEDDPESREFYLNRKVDPRILDASMTPEIVKAIVQSAHEEGLKVSAHSICLPEGIKQAVDAGIDSVEHTPLGILDGETLAQMKEKKMYWVPTAFCFYHWSELMDDPEFYDREEIRQVIPEPYYSIGKKALDQQRQAIQSKSDPNWVRFYAEMSNFKQRYFPINFENAIKYGVKIIASVDAGMGGAGYVPHGFLNKELALFVEHGMDAWETIRTATLNPAELLGADADIGSIEPGKYADLVILRANPIEDIANLRQIEYVIKDGKIIYADNQRHSGNM